MNYLLRIQALKKVHGVLAISGFVESLLLREGWPRERIHRVYNPVGPAREIEKIRTQVPLLCVGSRLVVRKGVDPLIRSLAALKDLPWQLWICGDGPEKKHLESLVAQLGLSEKISFKGNVSFSKMQSIMASSLAVIQPLSGPEPFGLSVAEACALGVPVISFNVPAINEIVVHNESGLLAEAGDWQGLSQHIQSLVEDPNRAKHLNQGPEWIGKHFSPQQHLNQTLAAYQKAVAIAAETGELVYAT